MGKRQRTDEFELAQLLNDLPRSSTTYRLEYKPDTEIYHAGTVDNLMLYLVNSGEVELYSGSLDSHIKSTRMIIIDKLGVNGVFGLGALTGKHTTGAATAKKATVTAWRIEKIEEYMSNEPELGKAIAYYALSQLTKRERNIEMFTTLTAEKRIAKMLVDRAKGTATQNGGNVHILPPITHEEIAYTIGTSRKIATQHMAKFRRRGFVAYNRRSMSVYPSLERWLSQ